MGKQAVQFDTTQYEFTHGHGPRGYGGANSWAFDFGKGPEWCPTAGTYSDAKRWAAGVARERGVRCVEVCT